VAEDGGTPIAYTALPPGVSVVAHDGSRIGTVEHVLQIPEEDLFDGLVVKTTGGLRFVDRDQIDSISTTKVTCSLTDDQIAGLPEPDGTAAYDVDPAQDSGRSLHDIFGRMFGRPRWTQEK
jgi:hypothetical protein